MIFNNGVEFFNNNDLFNTCGKVADNIPQRESTLIIDYRNSAIGSGSCGPALKESLRISEKEFDFEFSVKPEVTGNKIPEIEYGKLV